MKKSKEELEIMREGGRILAAVMAKITGMVEPGRETLELDTTAERGILEAEARPAFKGFRDYPLSLCVSINDAVVHGLPSRRKILAGDLVGIDLGVFYRGFYTDMAVTVGVPPRSREDIQLLQTTKNALARAIDLIKPGVRLGTIQHAIDQEVKKAGFSVVRSLTGHGIGRDLHEPPSIPNFGTPGSGVEIGVGMTFAIEPMVVAGNYKVKVAQDGWTVVTVDRGRAAHFEHTIAVTDSGAEILTKSYTHDTVSGVEA